MMRSTSGEMQMTSQRSVPPDVEVGRSPMHASEPAPKLSSTASRSPSALLGRDDRLALALFRRQLATGLMLLKLHDGLDARPTLLPFGLQLA